MDTGWAGEASGDVDAGAMVGKRVLDVCQSRGVIANLVFG
jgi:hypothetical protein